MWLFSTPKDYSSEMVEKISKSVFFIWTIVLFVFQYANEEFAQLLKKWSFGASFEIYDIKISIALFYIPLAIGILEHMFKIHDRISGILGIRRKYDRNVIVKEFVKSVNKEMDRKTLKNKVQSISNKKIKEIMNKCFYRYASSTDPKIDQHDVILAINEWCWFWIVLESIIILSIVAIIVLIMNFSWCMLFKFLGAIAFLDIVGFLIVLCCVHYSKNEIRAILNLKTDDGQGKVADIIKETIENALSN